VPDIQFMKVIITPITEVIMVVDFTTGLPALAEEALPNHLTPGLRFP